MEYKISSEMLQKLIDLIITNCKFIDCADLLAELKKLVDSQGGPNLDPNKQPT